VISIYLPKLFAEGIKTTPIENHVKCSATSNIKPGFEITVGPIARC
jgi:hypothetical protein